MMDMATARRMAARLSGRPGSLRDEGGATVDLVTADLGRVSEDLHGCFAQIAVRDGVLIIERLAPERHPAFLAMPNSGIEAVAALALRMVRTEAGGEGFVCRDGRLLRADGVLVAPEPQSFPDVVETVRPPEARARDIRLSAISVAAAGGAIGLASSGVIDPIVMIAVPAPLLYGWALYRRALRSALMERILPLLNEHAGRLAAQAKSITAAANRARGLGVTT